MGKKLTPMTVYCSFCGKSQHEVDVLVKGPGAAVCDACVEQAALIVTQRREASAAGRSALEREGRDG